MSKCYRCSKPAEFDVDDNHGIPQVSWSACSAHVGSAVKRIMREDPVYSACVVRRTKRED